METRSWIEAFTFDVAKRFKTNNAAAAAEAAAAAAAAAFRNEKK
jgi:hypothetical protein